jgi:hypothetical protein
MIDSFIHSTSMYCTNYSKELKGARIDNPCPMIEKYINIYIYIYIYIYMYVCIYVHIYMIGNKKVHLIKPRV